VRHAGPRWAPGRAQAQPAQHLTEPFERSQAVDRQEVVDEVLASGLRGRGGGGFPTGKKWQMALNTPSEQKYMICNADEGDPGAFMDRAVCESDPHRLLEGMITGCYAIGATKAYIYIRAEYPLAIERLKVAIAQAKERGFLGKNVMGTDFSLEIIIKMGAGAFVCGEETALHALAEAPKGLDDALDLHDIHSDPTDGHVTSEAGRRRQSSTVPRRLCTALRQAHCSNEMGPRPAGSEPDADRPRVYDSAYTILRAQGSP
jgi:hypothetical protein